MAVTERRDDHFLATQQPDRQRDPAAFSQWPEYDEEQIDAALAVLRSGRVNYWNGEQGRAFEREFADATQTKYAVALANGTLALEAALHAVGIGPGDEVIVPARTFIATASCVVMRGAIPVVADVDLESQTITAETIEAKLTPRTRAIIVVHLAGRPCEMDPILTLARSHNLRVIEDCAQAHGAKYKGRPVGSLGDAGAYSFCTDKIMSTAGEGGMLVTNNEDLWRKTWSAKDHGKSYSAVYDRQHGPGFRWLHESFGSNWRMTELQAAIGRVQLRRLDDWVNIRRANARMLAECCARFPALRVESPPSHIEHSYYRFYAFVRPKLLQPWDRDRIMEAIVAEGVPCFSGSCGEIYLEKAFNQFPVGGRLPNAKRLAETSLALLVDPTLTAAKMAQTCMAIETVMRHASHNAAAASDARHVA